MSRPAAKAEAPPQPAQPQPVVDVCLPDRQPVTPVTIAEGHLLRAGTVTPLLDAVAEEVPVALAYNGVSHAVMMATPADLEDFGLGFSLSEAIIESPDELLDSEVMPAAQGMIVYLTISARRFAGLKQRRRNLAGRTGCGLCGVDSLDQAIRPLRPLRRHAPIARTAIERAFADLPRWQVLNQTARSLHAAAWADASGAILLAKEDVGRHNALDKLIGALAAAKIDPASGFALLTSRCSYEMVQKSATAGIAMLAAISAPTALALRMAEAAGVTVICAGRADGMRVYSHPQAIDCTGLNAELIAAE
jgi:FdhD protein